MFEKKGLEMLITKKKKFNRDDDTFEESFKTRDGLWLEGFFRILEFDVEYVFIYRYSRHFGTPGNPIIISSSDISLILLIFFSFPFHQNIRTFLSHCNILFLLLHILIFGHLRIIFYLPR